MAKMVKRGNGNKTRPISISPAAWLTMRVAVEVSAARRVCVRFSSHVRSLMSSKGVRTLADKTISIRSLARRSGEPLLEGLKMNSVKAEEWRKGLDGIQPVRMRPERAMTLTTFNDVAVPTRSGIPTAGGRHALKTLPFSMSTFRLITERFYTHSDIARAVSRADVASYLGASVRIGEHIAYGTVSHSGSVHLEAYRSLNSYQLPDNKRVEYGSRSDMHLLSSLCPYICNCFGV